MVFPWTAFVFQSEASKVAWGIMHLHPNWDQCTIFTLTPAWLQESEQEPVCAMTPTPPLPNTLPRGSTENENCSSLGALKYSHTIHLCTELLFPYFCFSFLILDLPPCSYKSKTKSQFWSPYTVCIGKFFPNTWDQNRIKVIQTHTYAQNIFNKEEEGCKMCVLSWVASSCPKLL